MCAVFGLGGGAVGSLPESLGALDEEDHRSLLHDWIGERGGRAEVTKWHPDHLNPVILGGANGRRELVLGYWWIWPNASGPAEFDAFNSRVDRLALSPAWRGPFQRRALSPASWYREKGRDFELPGGEAFGIATITRTVPIPGGAQLVTYSLVTRHAVGEAADTWHRMPLILPRDAHDRWLDPAQTGDEELAEWALRESEGISQAMTRVTDDMLF
ncbi:SOS response-associated peptidase family protein [Leucobacter sp. GX24907]